MEELVSLEKWPFDKSEWKPTRHHADLRLGAAASNDDLADLLPSPEGSDTFTLCLHNGIQSDSLNVAWLKLAQQRKDIANIYIPYECWVRNDVRLAIQNLLADDRPWTVTICRGTAFRGIQTMHHFSPTSQEESTSDDTPVEKSQSSSSIQHLKLLGPEAQKENLSNALTSIPTRKLQTLLIYSFTINHRSLPVYLPLEPESFLYTIQTLTISFCAIPVMAMDRLCQFLDGAHRLTSFTLSGCGLGDHEIFRVIQALHHRTCGGLQVLDLHSNYCSSTRTVEALADWLKDPSCTLQSLNMNSLFWPPITALLNRTVSRLYSFHVLWEALAVNTTLRQLGLARLHLDDSDAELLNHALHQNRTLSVLRMDDNPHISIRGWSMLRDQLKGMTSAATLDAIFYEPSPTETSHMSAHFREKKAVLQSIRCTSLMNLLLLDLHGCSSSNNVVPMGMYPCVLAAVSKNQQVLEEKALSSAVLYGLLQHLIGSGWP